MSLLEEGEAPIDLKDLTAEFQALQSMGYVTRREDAYDLREEGKRAAEGLSDAWNWQKSESDVTRLLEQGLFSVEPLAGSIPKEVIKANHHFTRLRPVDWDEFIVLAGDAERSARLEHAVRLTEGFERFSFKLNQLGQKILNRNMDTLRGLRWIDENAWRLLAEEITKTNPELSFDFKSS